MKHMVLSCTACGALNKVSVAAEGWVVRAYVEDDAFVLRAYEGFLLRARFCWACFRELRTELPYE